jgi:hypothetical protein
VEGMTRALLQISTTYGQGKVLQFSLQFLSKLPVVETCSLHKMLLLRRVTLAAEDGRG